MFAQFYNENLRSLFESLPNTDARMAVVGVGGGGGNAVNNMVEKGIRGLDFIAINTDSQVLASNGADYCIQVGNETTGGLGAGGHPEVGVAAVKESRDEITRALEPYDMVFITAGMGGGTGTGGAPVVASFAQDMGVLTVGIVTRPFECEGPRRMEVAEQGIERLCDEADTLLVIPNERLLDLADKRTSLVEAFEMADEVLYDATRGISDLIIQEGLVNLDFADVETTMRDGGVALLGMSSEFRLRESEMPRVRVKSADGSTPPGHSDESPSEKAAVEAISSPLFDGRSIRGADKALVNVTGGPSLGFREVMSAAEVVQEEAGEDCEMIFGTVIDEEMEGHFEVTVIATGLDDTEPSNRATRIQTDDLDRAVDLDQAAELGERTERNGAVNGDGDTAPVFLDTAME